MSSDKTPIRIRGKRSGAQCEKWHAGKLRRHVHLRADASCTSVSASPESKQHHRPTKRRRLDLSALEQLPTEMVQAIFVQSGNLALPMSSPDLVAQLSGRQLQWELTCNTLSLVVSHSDDTATSATSTELSDATRLLNSRFMTWKFFQSWLDHESDARNFDISEPRVASDEPWHSRYADIWVALRPSSRLSLPTKIVRGPWTGERISLLKVFSLYPDACSTPLDGIVAEVAHEGFEQAIEQQCLEVIKLLRKLQVRPNQELLRKAVIDHGCDKSIVLYLLQWFVVDIMRCNIAAVTDTTSMVSRPEVDFLDPMLWAWTEKAKAVGEAKGEWLTAILRRFSNAITSEDRDELGRLEQDDTLYISEWQ
ncbi:hypothetical protein MBLNU13_g07663t1 [Cladosporium sp. NU13]